MTISAPSLPHVAPYARGSIVRVDIARTRSPPYDIIIGENVLGEAGTLLDIRLGKRRCLIVTDSNVGRLYLSRLEAVMTQAGHKLLPSITVEAGEPSKDYTTLQALLDRMLALGIDRKTVIVAFGGGVIGDLAGVASSLALRGLDFVQIPTTLLAQVDSSVGGKTGINTDHGKNTVGSFHQPQLVIVDVNLLDSLPRREMQAGYAEVVKYGLIRDDPFFRWCNGNGAKLLSGDREAQVYAIGASCAHKAAIVANDERETGERAMLNLGHSFGHALEAITGYDGTLLHGEAVSIGMVMAFRLSAKLGICPQNDVAAMRDHLAAVGLPVSPKRWAHQVDRLMGFMLQDKKVIDGKMTLILARGIGKAVISREVDEGKVRELWLECATDD